MSETHFDPKTSGLQPTMRCDLCGCPHIFGNHMYYGQFYRQYQLQACDGCRRDGSVPKQYESVFEAHLSRHRLDLPELNEQGQYPLTIWGGS